MSVPAASTAFPSYSTSGFATRCIHAGQAPDPITGAVTTPISLATTFAQRSPGEHTGYEYSRTGNPTRAAFEAAIASLEGATYGLAFASGSATTATITNMLSAGDHIISVDDVYGGTNRYFKSALTTTETACACAAPRCADCHSDMAALCCAVLLRCASSVAWRSRR